MDSNSKVKSISVLGAFALAVGTAIGWGSFVVTGSSFVLQAGPLGSIIGIIVGMLIMMVVAYNYHYMMNKYPGKNGGIYSFAKHTIGADHGFLLAWYLIITYAAILWANVSSFSLFSQYLFGSTFEFGFHYVIGGYDIWLGEILLSSFFLFLFGGICLLNKKITSKIQIGFVFIFIAIIIGGFLTFTIMHEGGFDTYKPLFADSEENNFTQVMRVISMTPWAYIGFESISHQSKGFSFASKKIFKVFFISLVTITALYILMCQIVVLAYPKDQYKDWYDYLSHASPTGFNKVSAFYVAHYYLGTFGVVIFAIALFSILVTSIIGNIFALSNLIYSMAKDDILPKALTKKDKYDNPRNIILGIIIFSFLMLFLGRVLVGWIVDVNSICGIIVYGYIAAIALYQAIKDNDKKAKITGIIGLVIGLMFALMVIISDIASNSLIEKESIVIFFSWTFIGFIYYIFVIKHDTKKRYGHSMAALFGLFFLIAYSIASWIVANIRTDEDVKDTIASVIIGGSILLATQAAFFVVFSIIRKREVEVQDKLVLGMATMVEGRDNSTGGHIRRTSKVVELIVNEMKKDDVLTYHHKFYENIIKAAPMHDLGKIAVDDAILRKPGKFTPEEYEVMKRHASEGAKYVKEVLSGSADEDLEMVAINVAKYHHERWDGNGYPEKLKGEEIPLEARIMAVADVYDALVSKRVYKEGFSFEDANNIILEGMGKQFDPGLEKYYLAARSKIEEYYKESNN